MITWSTSIMDRLRLLTGVLRSNPSVVCDILFLYNDFISYCVLSVLVNFFPVARFVFSYVFLTLTHPFFFLFPSYLHEGQTDSLLFSTNLFLLGILRPPPLFPFINSFLISFTSFYPSTPLSFIPPILTFTFLVTSTFIFGPQCFLRYLIFTALDLICQQEHSFWRQRNQGTHKNAVAIAKTNKTTF